MNKSKNAVNVIKLVAAMSLAGLLAACGGGDGGSAAGTATGSTPGTGTTQPQQQPIDPYTGSAAAGTPTAQISGSVVSGRTAAATVTAYLVNPDGSNGASIGQTTTDATGAYSMTLSQTPLGMIRLVATGGSFTSEADNSTQKNVALQLVAPYVTTALSNFVITPVTHLASTRFTYLASKSGQTLASAYTTASSAVLQLVTGNDVIAGSNRTHGGVDYLGIVPGSAQDTLNAYSDALTAIEYYGVQHDLPSHVVVRLLSTSSETGTPKQVDGNGQAIPVGGWVGTTFDEAQPVTLAQLSGAAPAPDVLSIVMAMNAVQACTSGDHTGYYQRFPLAAGQTDYLDTTGCAAYTNNLNAIKAKVTTNNRAKYVS